MITTFWYSANSSWLKKHRKKNIPPGRLRHDPPASVSGSRFLASRQLSDDIDRENSGSRDDVVMSLPMPRPRCIDPVLANSNKQLAYLQFNYLWFKWIRQLTLNSVFTPHNWLPGQHVTHWDMVPTTLQNSFSLTLQHKMNCFPWVICSHEIPMPAFNRLQSH